jgi:integrase
MGLRERLGKWHYRFMVAGRWYSDNTGLVATERNKTGASRIEAEAHKLVVEGKAHLLKLQPIRFSEAAKMFLSFVDGEYREHPSSADRIRGSFSSLAEFFKREMVATITPGGIEDYKGHRRGVDGVREVTLRHDLHALSLFFQYAKKHNWVKDNAVREVEIPSDADAVRIHVLIEREEKLYFATAEKKMAELAAERKPRPGGRQGYNGFEDLGDAGRLMLLQGCRPEELLALEAAHVDLERGTLSIVRGKSPAARRTLRLRGESRDILARRISAGGRWIFPSPRKRGAHITKLNKLHDAVLEDCGLCFVPYDLRHTFATRAAAGGMPLATLAKILGHGNLRSVLKYVHPDQGSMDREMERLDAALEQRNVDSEIHGPKSGQVPQVNMANKRETQVGAGNTDSEALSARKIN